MSVFALSLVAAAAVVVVLVAILVVSVSALQRRLAIADAEGLALARRVAAAEVRQSEQAEGMAALAARLDHAAAAAALDRNRLVDRAARLEAHATEQASGLAGLLARHQRAEEETGAEHRRLQALASDQGSELAELRASHTAEGRRVGERMDAAERLLSDQGRSVQALRARADETDTAYGADLARVFARLDRLAVELSERAHEAQRLGGDLDAARARATEQARALDALAGGLTGVVDRQARLAFRAAGTAARLALALEDARAHGDVLARLDRGLAEQGGRSRLVEDRVALTEERLNEHADWLGGSHEPWLQRHDDTLAHLDGRLRAADERFQEHENRLAAADAAAATAAAGVEAHEAWLGGSHEPWLQGHDAQLADLGARAQAADDSVRALTAWLDDSHEPWLQGHDAQLADLGARAQAADDSVRALTAWVDDSHEPWLRRHDATLAEVQESLKAAGDVAAEHGERLASAEARAAEEAARHSDAPWPIRDIREMRDHDERLHQLEYRIRDAEEQVTSHERLLDHSHEPWLVRLGEAVDRLEAGGPGSAAASAQGSLDQLSQQLERHEQQIAACINWLGGSHEPWLSRHDGFINRLLVDLPAYVGTLDQLLAASWQVQGQLLDGLDQDNARRAEFEASRRAIVDLKLRRRDARRRGLLPNGEPGPCEGIRLARGRRPILVVAFSGMHDVFGWLPRLEALEVNCVHVVDTSETWYLDGCDGARSIDSMMDAIRAAIAGFDYEHMLVIGQSMGGYAALRFGPELGADLLAVFGPQTHRMTETTLDHGEFIMVPEGAIDVRPGLLASGVETHVFVSRSEREAAYVWDDHGHLEGLAGAPHMHIHVAACDDHGVAGHISKRGLMNPLLESLFSLVEGGKPGIDLDDL